MTKMNELSNLKQHIGFFGLLAMSVGLNIGGSLFALTTLAAGMSGPSLPLAGLISSIPCLIAVVPYCLLASSLPTTAATYRYIQLINPAVSLISMLTLLVCILIGAQPLFALAFGMYLKELIGINPIISGLIACILVIGINLLIFLFFVVAIGTASFVFFGIALCATIYAFFRKESLANFDITSAFPELKNDISKIKYETVSDESIWKINKSGCQLL